ncbi:MAG: GxGYxYP domain-containing protein [Candidatus Sigynarchaeum springense]
MGSKFHAKGFALLLLLACLCGMAGAPSPRAATNTTPAAIAQVIPSGPTPGSPFSFEVVDVRGWGLTTDGIYLLSSLEGIVNRDAARLYVIWGNDGAMWLNSIDDEYYTPSYLSVTNLSALLAYYDSFIDGVVVFDNQAESANIATPICGINRSVMVSAALAPTALAWPALQDEPVVANMTALYAARGFTSATPKGDIYRWAFDTWFRLCNQSALGMYDYQHAGAIRSLLAGNAIFTMWQVCYTPEAERDAPADFECFEYILANTPQDMIVFGYMYPDGGNEHPVVSRLSANGKALTPSDWLRNAPFLQNLPLPDGYTFRQKARAEADSIPLENKVYIAGIYSDGDNMQYVANFMRWNLWESAAHKTSPVPCSWEMSPSVLKIAPAIARFYYDNASMNDYFVTGVGGKGYTKAEYMTAEYTEIYWRTTRELMARLDQREVRSWTGNFGKIVAAMNGAPGIPPQCDGIYEGYGGGSYTAPAEINGVPVVYMHGWTAHNSGDLQGFYDDIAELRAQVPSAPVFVCYHLICWDAPYALWAEFANTLEAGGDVVFVTVAQMSSLISRSAVGAMTTGGIVLAIAGIWGIPLLVHVASGARQKKASRAGGALP